MSIHRKSKFEVNLMKQAGNIVALVHAAMKDAVKEGVTTKELDELAFKIIKANKADPTFLGYNGFPASICTSINEQVVHGIPSDEIILKNGDII
ncbi:MAG: M24 family metallopeptidase, partial [Candidatus Gastranaerophilales bacterium]|nr:M24 family metallopeptidase [Candidatus Gastranaerophilales bacterium]